MAESREHQIVWVSPEKWMNEVTVTDIHTHENHEFGYAHIGPVTWLVQHVINQDMPAWVIVGWVRTS